jgi:DNA-binding MarR family transcriptional regulator
LLRPKTLNILNWNISIIEANPMKSLERRTADFAESVRTIVGQFQRLNALAANGPHAELSQQEVRLIEHLRLGGPQKMKDVSEYLGVAVNTVTNIVDNLEGKNLVVRERSPQDRRVVHVQLTELGQSVGDASVRAKRELLRSMLQRLPDSEQEILVRLSRKIARGAGMPESRAVEVG